VRVIAGSARGRPLKAPDVPVLRPTSDKVRGAIFNMIGPFFDAEERVLDLFAGTGALGIEALSRGAGWCDFVEQDRRCAAAIQDNLRATGLADRARVWVQPVAQALARLQGPYTLVLLDPPYTEGIDPAILRALVDRGLLTPDTVVVAEHAWRVPAAERFGPLVREKQRRSGHTRAPRHRHPCRGAVRRGDRRGL
jgi:16S rRNA (guanine966-N2)-methyltransferase